MFTAYVKIRLSTGNSYSHREKQYGQECEEWHSEVIQTAQTKKERASREARKAWYNLVVKPWTCKEGLIDPGLPRYNIPSCTLLHAQGIEEARQGSELASMHQKKKMVASTHLWFSDLFFLTLMNLGALLFSGLSEISGLSEHFLYLPALPLT